jgi:hypothetical protein
MVLELQQKLALILYPYLFQTNLAVIIQKYYIYIFVSVNHQSRQSKKTKGCTFCSAIKLYNGLCNKIMNVNAIQATTELYKMILKRHNNKKYLRRTIKIPTHNNRGIIPKLRNSLSLIQQNSDLLEKNMKRKAITRRIRNHMMAESA